MMRVQSRCAQRVFTGLVLALLGAVAGWSGLVYAQAPTPAKGVKLDRKSVV